MDELNMPQDNATPVYIDNNGAMLMANAQQPTRRTRHMDMKKVVLLDWVNRDLITFKRITSSNNYSDTLTKVVTKELHYRHNDYILGKWKPGYCMSH